MHNDKFLLRIHLNKIENFLEQKSTLNFENVLIENISCYARTWNFLYKAKELGFSPWAGTFGLKSWLSNYDMKTKNIFPKLLK